MPKHADSLEAVCAAAARIAQDQDASVVMLVTETGEAPRMTAKYRPRVPIVACCPNEVRRSGRDIHVWCTSLRNRASCVCGFAEFWGIWGQAVARQCALLRGVIAIVIPWQEGSEFATVSVSRVIAAAITKVKTMGIVTEGKAVVLHDSVRSPFCFVDHIS